MISLRLNCESPKSRLARLLFFFVMSDPSSSKSGSDSKRDGKRKKQRAKLSAFFGDALLRVSVPVVVRKYSAEIDKGTTQFEECIQILSAKSNEIVDSRKQVREYNAFYATESHDCYAITNIAAMQQVK